MALKIVKLAVLATDGCLGSSVFGMLDVFSCANFCAQQSGVAVKLNAFVISKGGRSVETYNGLGIEASGGLSAARMADVIIVAPIMPATTPSHLVGNYIDPLRDLLPWLRKQAERGAVLASSCTGSFLLAEAGLLDGCIATTHWRASPSFRRRYPAVVLREHELVTESGRILCGGGAVSHVDLGLHLVRRYAGREVAFHCAGMLVMDPGRTHQTPYSELLMSHDHQDSAILKAQAWIESNYWRPIQIPDLARRLGMSERTLKRRFAAACAGSITGYVQDVRLLAARDRLATCNDSPQQIVIDVGYEDLSSFARLFKSKIGITMGEYRERFRLAV